MPFWIISFIYSRIKYKQNLTKSGQLNFILPLTNLCHTYCNRQYFILEEIFLYLLYFCLYFVSKYKIYNLFISKINDERMMSKFNIRKILWFKGSNLSLLNSISEFYHRIKFTIEPNIGSKKYFGLEILVINYFETWESTCIN